MSTVSGCAPPSVRRAIRVVSSSVSTASRRSSSVASGYDIYFADGSGKTVDADGLRVVVRGHVHAAATLSAAVPGANGEL